MKRAIVLAVALILAVAGYLHAATITLRACSEVPSMRPVTLGSVAAIEAPEQLGGRIAQVVVASAPLPGARRTIDAAYIKAKLDAAGFEDDVSVSGPDTISVVGRAIKFSVDQLAEEVRNFVLGQLPNDSRTYDVKVERPPRELVLADDGREVRIVPRLMGRCIKLGPNTIAVDAVADGRVIATTSAAVQVQAVAEVLVARRQISQGEVLNDGNTGWEQRDVTRIPNAFALAEGGQVADWIARRTLRAGSTITFSDVMLPPTVKQGDTVTLVVRCGSVTLRTTAQCKQEGRTSDMVRVRPAVSGEDVRARIIGPGQVEITR